MESGQGVWYLGNGGSSSSGSSSKTKKKLITLKAGDDITIPRFVAHRFVNMPGSVEPLSILYRYDAQMYRSTTWNGGFFFL